jgi:hypothetical protein
MHAQEISHNEQMKYVKDTYLKIKTDILSCAQLTNTVSSSTQSVVERVTEFEDRVRLIEVQMERDDINPGFSRKSNSGNNMKSKTAVNACAFSPPTYAYTAKRLCQNDSISLSKNVCTPEICLETDKQGETERSVSFNDVTSYTPEAEKVGKTIPVRVTTREQQVLSGDRLFENDFKLVERKRTERFCVLCLSS